MAIPELSPEARAEALEKAKAARIKRAQVREELKAGKLTSLPLPRCSTCARTPLWAA